MQSRSCENFEAPLQLNLGCIALSEAFCGSSQQRILAVAYTTWSTLLASQMIMKGCRACKCQKECMTGRVRAMIE